MRRVSYTDPDGTVYLLNDGITAWLKKGGLFGFGMSRAELAMQRVPYQDGATLLGAPYTGPRELRVAVEIATSGLPSRLAYERAMRSALSPYKDTNVLGVLTLEDTDNAVTRHIDCWLVECPDAEHAGPGLSTLTYTFIAPAPFFYEAESVESTAMSGGGITFPVTPPFEFIGTGIDAHINVTNPGDVEVWPVIRIVGDNGKDPTVENEATGKVLALTAAGGVTLDTGDYIDIDMAEGTVKLYDASAGTTTSIIELLSATSEFWSLKRGGNSIHVTMTLVTSGSVTLTYNPLYIGA
jgi:hypothetical protein